MIQYKYTVQTELGLTVCGLYSGHYTYRVSDLSSQLVILYHQSSLISVSVFARLRVAELENRGYIPHRSRDFSLLLCVHT